MPAQPHGRSAEPVLGLMLERLKGDTLRTARPSPTTPARHRRRFGRIAILAAVIVLQASLAGAEEDWVPDGSWGTHGSELGDLYHPYDVVTSTDENPYIYVVDNVNHRIQVFNTDGSWVSTIGGGQGSGPTQLYYPEAADLNDDGSVIFVADTFNNRIRTYSTTFGTHIGGWGSEGSADGQFLNPNGIAVYEGEVYVTDKRNARVQVFSTIGEFHRKWGQFGSDDGEFISPSSIDVFGGFVYVSDEQQGTIQVFTTAGAFVSKFGTRGSEPGQLDFPDEIRACRPFIVPILYVAEAGNSNRVTVLTIHDDGSAPTFSDVLTGTAKPNSSYDHPHGVDCYYEHGFRNVYVASTNESRIYAMKFAQIKVKAEPAKSKAAYIKRGSLLMDLSHNGLTKTCNLEASSGTIDFKDGEEKVFKVKGGGLPIPPKKERAYEINLLPAVARATSNALRNHKSLHILVHLKIPNCINTTSATKKVEFTID